jgi:hypothetical protein
MHNFWNNLSSIGLRKDNTYLGLDKYSNYIGHGPFVHTHKNNLETSTSLIKFIFMHNFEDAHTQYK